MKDKRTELYVPEPHVRTYTEHEVAQILTSRDAMLTVAQCISEQAPRIYVREEVNGKWDSYALTELPAELAILHVLRFIAEGRMPVVMVDD